MSMLRTLVPAILLAAGAPLAAEVSEGSIRIVPQILVGTSGFEPGVAGEFRAAKWDTVIVRPELFISDDEDLGGGGSLLWDLDESFGLSGRHSFAIGPRLVFHNSDEHGLEGSALGMWNIVVGDDLAKRHSIEVLAALGIVDDRDHGDGIDLAVSAGAAYAYRF